MKPTQRLHELGQSLWLDNINRELVTSGELQQQGANSFVQSWNDLMDVIAFKRVELKKAS
jgi:hypothetical protein